MLKRAAIVGAAAGGTVFLAFAAVDIQQESGFKRVSIVFSWRVYVWILVCFILYYVPSRDF